MADFCSLCYYGDIDYNKLIKDNLEKINSIIEENGSCFVSDGICEGCGKAGIRIDKDNKVYVEGKDYVGNIDQETYEVIIDESSDIFKNLYKDKKLRHIEELKSFLNEDWLTDEGRKHIESLIEEMEK